MDFLIELLSPLFLIAFFPLVADDDGPFSVYEEEDQKHN